MKNIFAIAFLLFSLPYYAFAFSVDESGNMSDLVRENYYVIYEQSGGNDISHQAGESLEDNFSSNILTAKAFYGWWPEPPYYIVEISNGTQCDGVTFEVCITETSFVSWEPFPPDDGPEPDPEGGLVIVVTDEGTMITEWTCVTEENETVCSATATTTPPVYYDGANFQEWLVMCGVFLFLISLMTWRRMSVIPNTQ